MIFGYLTKCLAWCPEKVQYLFIGAICLFAIFIIAKLIIVIKDIVFQWL